MKPQFTLTEVQPRPDGTLHLSYADGQTFCVDIAPIIARSPILAPLRQPDLLAQARLGPWGGSVCFGEDEQLELAADNLRARAIEQMGGYSHESLWRWMYRHNLTQHAAADALGVSRRMLGYYLSGAKPIPRTLALACLGWEVQQKRAA